MTLDEWMSKHNRRDGELAAEVGVDRTYILKVRRRVKQPSLDVATRLQELTGIPAISFRLTEVERERIAGNARKAAA